MSFREGEAGLTGIAKVMAYIPGGGAALPARATLAPGKDGYGSNIQVADVNALNANQRTRYTTGQCRRLAAASPATRRYAE